MYYFPTMTTGMRLYGILKEAGIKATIAPTPRVASKCCGISLLVREEDLEAIRKFIDENHIEILKIAAIERILIHGGTDIVKKLILSEE